MSQWAKPSGRSVHHRDVCFWSKEGNVAARDAQCILFCAASLTKISNNILPFQVRFEKNWFAWVPLLGTWHCTRCPCSLNGGLGHKSPFGNHPIILLKAYWRLSNQTLFIPHTFELAFFSRKHEQNCIQMSKKSSHRNFAHKRLIIVTGASSRKVLHTALKCWHKNAPQRNFYILEKYCKFFNLTKVCSCGIWQLLFANNSLGDSSQQDGDTIETKIYKTASDSVRCELGTGRFFLKATAHGVGH